MILHLLTGAEWVEARAVGEVRPASLEGEGFVHCSTPEQLPGVVERFYRAEPDLVVLRIDATRAPSELRWEPPAHPHPDPDERFPHLYGPIPLDAVLQWWAWADWRAEHAR